MPNDETRTVYRGLDRAPWPTDYWIRVAIDALRDAKPHPVLSRREVAQDALYWELGAEVRRAAPKAENAMYTELLNAALAQVDRYEIAILLVDRALREEGHPTP